MNKCNICGKRVVRAVNAGLINGNLCERCYNENYIKIEERPVYLRIDYGKLDCFINSNKAIKYKCNKEFISGVLEELRKRYNLTFVGYRFSNNEMRLGYEYLEKNYLNLIKLSYVYKEQKIKVEIIKRGLSKLKIVSKEMETYEFIDGKIKKHQ